MIRSMYSGISGLKNFQTKLDVIGNNISNVNTYGFKKGRTVFKDLISQTTAGASGSTDTRGGVNPKQVGLGSQLAAIDTIHSGGALQSTGNTLDLGISGDGFFQVADGNPVDTGEVDGDNNPVFRTEYTNTLYTRAGNFYMDNQGFLVNSDGKFLVGFSAYAEKTYENEAGDTIDITVFPTPDKINTSSYKFDNRPIYDGDADDSTDDIPIGVDYAEGITLNDDILNVQYQPIKIPTSAQSMSVGQDGTVTFVDSEGTLRWAGQLVMSKFSNPGGLEKTGANYFRETSNSGIPELNVATKGGNGSINSGFLEMSNVDLSEEFTDMIVAQRGFQANTRIITTSDSILEELINLKR